MQISASNNMFFTRQGRYIDTVEASTKRNWLLSKMGDGTTVIPITEPKLRAALVEFGGWMLSTHPLVKPYIGYIDTDREWTEDGPKVKTVAATGILMYRHDLKVDTTKNILKQAEKITGSAGAMILNILQRANSQEDTLIRPGAIWMGGPTREETLISDYYTHISNIANRVGCDFGITPKLAPSTSLLTLAFNVSQRQGADKSGFITLEEGVNIKRQPTPMIEQGPIYNQIIGIGNASTPTERVGAMWESAASRRRYGLRQKALTYPDVKEVATLTSNVQTQVGMSAFPRRCPRITITDQSLYKSIDEGDVVMLKTHTFGFGLNGLVGMSGKVRILGLEFDDDIGEMDAVVSEMIAA